MAWVLLWAWGTTAGFAVSGIASNEACEDLARRMATTYSFGAPNHSCLSYQIAH